MEGKLESGREISQLILYGLQCQWSVQKNWVITKSCSFANPPFVNRKNLQEISQAPLLCYLCFLPQKQPFLLTLWRYPHCSPPFLPIKCPMIPLSSKWISLHSIQLLSLDLIFLNMIFSLNGSCSFQASYSISFSY